MEIVIFLLLAAVWGAFLLPPLMKSRREAPISSTQEFDRSLARLASVQGYAKLQTASRRRIQARRRRVFSGLLAAAVLTLALAVARGSLNLLFLHLVIDALGVGYVAMLLHIKQQRRGATTASIEVPVEEPSEDTEVRLLAAR